MTTDTQRNNDAADDNDGDRADGQCEPPTSADIWDMTIFVAVAPRTSFSRAAGSTTDYARSEGARMGLPGHQDGAHREKALALNAFQSRFRPLAIAARPIPHFVAALVDGDEPGSTHGRVDAKTIPEIQGLQGRKRKKASNAKCDGDYCFLGSKCCPDSLLAIGCGMNDVPCCARLTVESQ
ncbi:hypothetical protein DM02DRAFT_628873 [Periconia macrospinosa]|uniref:Uncharacterized protein n=1 Tax=Periconia macrospinosa TaxID=97972 RepID=A0A2V1DPV2_9PLEO|nr:hypothetical protein DM02DRAFT_628873 [Periconia macrospinosa]